MVPKLPYFENREIFVPCEEKGQQHYLCKGAIEGVLFVMMGVDKEGFFTEVGILR